MKNDSGITPLGHRVLVKPENVEETTKSGIIIAIGSGRDREQMSQVMGTVVAVGNTCWKDQAEAEWAKPGDFIMFGKYSGLTTIGKDDVEYRLISDLDVVAKLDPVLRKDK